MSDTVGSATQSAEPIISLSRDIISKVSSLSRDEARFLVDSYYQQQENRKRGRSQERALDKTGEPHAVLGWLTDQSAKIEAQVKRVLDSYTKSHLLGPWLRSITGIGPVLAAGLMAHLDIVKAPTVGHFWSFGGIAGSGQKKWEKGQKRPFNMRLKTLYWLIGQSFMKLSAHPGCYYGHVYREYKAKIISKNESGGFAETAARRVSTVGLSTEAYKYYSAGRLPPGHIDAMARRYAVKLFLAHLHDQWYRLHYMKPPPLPYPIAHLGHVHYIPPPVQIKEPERTSAL